MDQPWMFDRFRSGQTLGRHREALDATSLAEWFALCPADRDLLPWMPPGLAIAVVMRAYMRVLPHRPPGNVHAGQDLDIVRLPGVDAMLTTILTCADKRVSNDRRRVIFATETTGDDGYVFFRSRISMIWAG